MNEYMTNDLNGKQRDRLTIDECIISTIIKLEFMLGLVFGSIYFIIAYSRKIIFMIHKLHFLYWLTKVLSFVPLECRSPEPRSKNIIVNVPVHCHSLYTSCSAVFETDPSAISGYYPIINVEGVVTVVYCIKP